jgi:hypothetical protein
LKNPKSIFSELEISRTLSKNVWDTRSHHPP